MSIIELRLSTYSRVELAFGAPSSAWPARFQSRRWISEPSATAARAAALFGTECASRRSASVYRRISASDSDRCGSASVCARRYAVPMALASSTTADRRVS